MNRLAIYCLGKIGKSTTLHVFMNGNGRLCRKSGGVRETAVGLKGCYDLPQAFKKVVNRSGCKMCINKIQKILEGKNKIG